MGKAEGIENMTDNGVGILGLEFSSPFFEILVDVDSLDKLHHEVEKLPSRPLRFSEVIDADDAWMTELRHRLRLLLETIGIVKAFTSNRQLKRQDLDGNLSIEAWLHRSVNCPHATTSQQCGDLVFGQRSIQLLGGWRLPT